MAASRFHDRMPVTRDWRDAVWMTGDDDPIALSRTPAEDVLQEWIVSPRVNRSDVGDDDATLIEPVAVYQVEKCIDGARRQVFPLAASSKITAQPFEEIRRWGADPYRGS